MAADFYNFFEGILIKKSFEGHSLRQLATNCQFQSSNYLQKICTNRIKVSPRSIKKIISGLDLNQRDGEKLYTLWRDEHGKNKIHHFLKSSEMFKHYKDKKPIVAIDSDSFSDWLNIIVLESLRLKPMAEEVLIKKLQNLGSADAIKNAIQVLVRQKIIKQNGSTFYPVVDTLQSQNDKRNINLQKIHEQFLRLAIHRLNKDVKDREYQFLTIPIAKDKFANLKCRIRKFLDELDEELSQEDEKDSLVHLQIASFFILEGDA